MSIIFRHYQAIHYPLVIWLLLVAAVAVVMVVLQLIQVVVVDQALLVKSPAIGH
jgi:hypothetical protein